MRCLHLAKTFSNSVVSDIRLLELDFGDWEGMRFDAINPEALQHWTDNLFISHRLRVKVSPIYVSGRKIFGRIY